MTSQVDELPLLGNEQNEEDDGGITEDKGKDYNDVTSVYAKTCKKVTNTTILMSTSFYSFCA